jgi:hypothetical protein
MAATRSAEGTVFSREQSLDFFCDDDDDSSCTSLLAPDDRVDVNSLSQSALMVPAYKGHDSIVAKLLECERLKVNAITMNDGSTALLFAAHGGHEHADTKLVECGRDGVNVTNKYQQTAMSVAAGEGRASMSLVALLLECARSNINVFNWSLANQIESERLMTLPADVSSIGIFVAHCWMHVDAFNVSNGIALLIMKFAFGFNRRQRKRLVGMEYSDLLYDTEKAALRRNAKVAVARTMASMKASDEAKAVAASLIAELASFGGGE